MRSMIHEIVDLKEFFPLPYSVTLECYCPSNFGEIDLNRKRKSIVIYPGGGYCMCSDREAEPVALQFVGEDCNAFVLKYSCEEKAYYPTPILEGLAAIAYIRRNAEKYNVDVNKIIVMGFSAGGHLAATVSAFWHQEMYAKQIQATTDEVKVNGAILCYPVISMKTYSHCLTRKQMTHDEPELIKLLSIEDQVTEHFPKTFIWHTTFDATVPVENTLFLVQSLTKYKIPYELHIFPNGVHGISLANFITKPVDYDACVVKETEIWMPLCKKFNKEEF